MSTRTTSQGILVVEGGDPASAIQQGMPTADSVDAAVARLGGAVVEATDARLAAEQVLAVYGDAGVIIAARDDAVAAAQQAIINIGSQAEDLDIDAAIAGVVSTAAGAQGRLDNLSTRLPVDVTDPAYGLTGTTDNTAAIQAALDAAAGQRPVRFPRRPLGQPYIVTGGGSGAVLLKVAAGQVLTGDGTRPRIKVKDGTGNYKAIIGGATAATDLTGLVVRDLTIDQNCTGNPVANVATLLVNGTQRFVVYAGAGNGITLRDVSVINVDTVNVFYIGSPTMKDVRVQDCEFDLVGASTGRHDHSTLYVSCDGMQITGNKFRGVLGGIGAASAIETHGPNQIVSDNRIFDYYRAMNITGVAATHNRNTIVTDNVCRNVMVGIDLWSYAGANGGLINCDISTNIVDILRDPWLIGTTEFPNGINIAATSTGHIENLRICDNTITYQPFSAAALANEYQAAGIQLFTIDQTVELRNLDVSGNTVVGALSAGLSIRMKVRRGRVYGNRWVDCGSSTEAAMASFYRSGMVFVGDFADLDVHNNRTFDTRATHKIAQGIQTSISGSLLRCEQWDNKVTCSDGAAVPTSVETFGKVFGTRAEATPSQPFGLGLYYGPKGSGTVPVTLNVATAVAFHVANPRTFDRIGCEITTAGVGASVRLGIYADNGSGAPGALVLDAGAVDATTIGTREANISRVLTPGLYWLVLCAQGATVQVRGVLPTSVPVLPGAIGLANATGTTVRIGYISTATITAALPATYPSAGPSASPGLVVVRTA